MATSILRLLVTTWLGAQASVYQVQDTVSLVQTLLARKTRTANDDILTKAEVGTECKGLAATVEGSGGGQFCLPSGWIGKPATSAVRSGKMWEPSTHLTIEKLMQATPQKGDLVTMGLFFGDYLPHMSLLAGKSNRVWGFEPNPDNFALARGTVGLNKLKNCWIANVAGGSKSGGTLDFCTSNAGGETLGGWTHVQRAGEDCTVTKVPVLSLDNVLPPHRRISLIHLDVEGQERNVLHGAQRTLQKWRPTLVLEDMAGVGSDLESYMKRLGYQQVARQENNRVLQKPGPVVSQGTHGDSEGVTANEETAENVNMEEDGAKTASNTQDGESLQDVDEYHYGTAEVNFTDGELNEFYGLR